MDRSRTVTAAVGLLASLLLSVAVWWYFNSLVLFLVVPFVPFLLRGGEKRVVPETRRCPACGFETTNDAYDYCPRDGRRLE